jgi:hypothetical protein
MERPMSLNDAAVYAGLTPGALRIAARNGDLEAVKVGRDWITTRAAVDAYLGQRLGGHNRKPDPRPARRAVPDQEADNGS